MKESHWDLVSLSKCYILGTRLHRANLIISFYDALTLLPIVGASAKGKPFCEDLHLPSVNLNQRVF